MGTRLSSLQKLNGLAEVFIDRDGGKLGRGEVDALAAFYGGLGAKDQAAVRGRLVEIYQTSTYERGQKAIFLDRLMHAGIPMETLEGAQGTGPDAFLALGKDAQLRKLQALEGGEGFVKDLRARDVPAGAKTKIAAGVERFKADFERRATGDAPEFGDETYHAVYLAEGTNGRGKDLVGFAVEVGIYHDDHDVDRMLFFNLKGEYLGNEYRGE